MRLVALTHAAFEGPGHIASWAQSRGHQLATLALHAGDSLPHQSDFDGLVAMGGPMSVHDACSHAWLRPEAELMARTAALGKPLLGVCLGAQLLAHALGAAVGKSPHREVGFFPVRRTVHGQDHHLTRRLPDVFAALHWHGDAFDIPRHAVHLFASQGCANQGFALGEHILGLQFHLEMTPDGLEALLANAADDLNPAGPWVQTAEAMRRDARCSFAQMQPLAEALLDRVFLEAD